MTKHEFIFSDQRRHRMARHAAFWVVWWLSFLILFHYPLHSFKGWNLNEPSSSFQELGLVPFILKTMTFNVLLAVIIPQMAFTCFLLYYLLPNYFFKKRNPFIIACVLVGVLLIYVFVAAAFKFIAPLHKYLYGLSKTSPTFSINSLVNIAIRDQLTTFPIVAGFAIMIKLIKRWWEKQKETEQLASEKIKAELQLLKAQIHPHFLFNTLNNIYFFTLSGSPKAPEMIKKLSGLLHYILNECNSSLVPLEKEIKMIQDYVALEKIRYGEQMNLTIEIPQNAPPLTGATEGLERSSGRALIAPLLLIPFVENSFKHGASKMLTQPYVKLRITIENNTLHFFITNSRPQTAEPALSKAFLTGRQGNIGLKNVKKRLHLLYPAAHELRIVSESECFTVYLEIQLHKIIDPVANNEEIKTTAAYAMA